MKSYSFLFWAYNVIWLGLAGYLLFLIMRVRRVDRRLDRAEQDRVPRRAPEPDQESSNS